MNEMKSLTLNDKTYDSFVDGVARPLANASAVICSASGESIVLSDSSNMPLVGLNVYGKSTQAGTPSINAPVDLVSVGSGGNMDVSVFSKNLLQNIATTQTINGVTFTVNDSIVTVDGTITDEFVQLEIGKMYCRANTPYALSGCPSGGGRSTYWLLLKSGKAFDYGTGTVFTYDVDTVTTVYLRLQRGITASGLTFRPMIRLASIANDTYESYSSNSLSVYTANGLLGVPVSSGGNYTDASGQKWCADEIDLERGVYIKRINKKTVTAETVITKHEYSNDNFFVAIIRESQKNASTDCLSTHFVKTTSGEALRTSACVYCMSNMVNAIHVSVPTTIANDITTFKNWAIANNLVVYHILATPIEIPLTDEEIAAYQALHTNKPSTTVLNDSGAYMTLKYVADTKSYIENKVSGILPATVE